MLRHGQSDEATSAMALAEMDALAEALREAGVRVHVFDDDDHTRPDSVFPNNWLSTHAGGAVAVYPMYASNRRHERRSDVLEMLKSDYRVQAIVDYSGLEPDGIFLEGTGAMVLDHVSRVAYTARSHRADTGGAGAVLHRLHLRADGLRRRRLRRRRRSTTPTSSPASARDVAMIALEMIPDEVRREQVRERLAVNGRTIVELTEEQVREFAGNAVELCGRTPEGKRRYIMAMSARAKRSLTARAGRGDRGVVRDRRRRHPDDRAGRRVGALHDRRRPPRPPPRRGCRSPARPSWRSTRTTRSPPTAGSWPRTTSEPRRPPEVVGQEMTIGWPPETSRQSTEAKSAGSI